MSDQSWSTPTQGETHQNVISPIVSDSQENWHADKQADKQRAASTSKLGEERAATMPGEINQLYCQSSGAKEGKIQRERKFQP